MKPTLFAILLCHSILASSLPQEATVIESTQTLEDLYPQPNPILIILPNPYTFDLPNGNTIDGYPGDNPEGFIVKILPIQTPEPNLFAVVGLALFLAHPLYLRCVEIAGRKLPCYYLTSDSKQNIGVYFRAGHQEMFKDYATCFDTERLAIFEAARQGYEVQK